MTAPTQRDIFTARRRIAGLTERTRLVPSPDLTALSGVPVHLKDEAAQVTGAFKLRGAANKILSLDEDTRRRGVITLSSGNHGRAVAHVAHHLGIPATIAITGRVPKVKADAIAALGAEVVVAGATQDEAEAYVLDRLGPDGPSYVHPFDDPLVIAGQGTIGLEVLDDLPGVGTVVVPLSGGGLIAGIALALKSADPSIRVVGVSQDRGPAMYHSLRAGRVVPVNEVDTLADALAGGLGTSNAHTLEMCSRLLDDTVLVGEDEIARAMSFAFARHHLMLEGGGAVGIAALLGAKVEYRGPTVVVASGGNIDPQSFLEVISSADS